MAWFGYPGKEQPVPLAGPSNLPYLPQQKLLHSIENVTLKLDCTIYLFLRGAKNDDLRISCLKLLGQMVPSSLATRKVESLLARNGISD